MVRSNGLMQVREDSKRMSLSRFRKGRVGVGCRFYGNLFSCLMKVVSPGGIMSPLRDIFRNG